MVYLTIMIDSISKERTLEILQGLRPLSEDEVGYAEAVFYLEAFYRENGSIFSSSDWSQHQVVRHQELVDKIGGRGSNLPEEVRSKLGNTAILLANLHMIDVLYLTDE